MKFNPKNRIAMALLGLGCFASVIASMAIMFIVFTFPLVTAILQPYILISLLLLFLLIWIIGGEFLCRLGLGLLITAILGHDNWDLR